MKDEGPWFVVDMASPSRRIAEGLKTRPSVYRVARHTRLWVGGRLPPRTIDRIPGRVHRNDLMLDDRSAPSVQGYARIGRQAAEMMDEALAASGTTFADVGLAMDLGCGHGRVLRWLVQRVAPATVTACDVDPEAVAFCATEFGVTPLVGSHDFDAVPFARYDLVWAGSVATHLPEDIWYRWVRLLPRVLQPGGVVVFTTHEPALVNEPRYSPELARQADVLGEALVRTGFAYFPYRHYRDDRYGVAFHDPERVSKDLAQVGLTRSLLRRRGWDGHQDVHAFTAGG